MDAYAKNFKRKGVDGQLDLLWFGMLEQFRYYGFKIKKLKTDKNSVVIKRREISLQGICILNP